MAMLNTTTFDFALKTRYAPDVVKNMAYKDNPFFAMVKKDENFGGKSLVFAVTYGTGPGRSHDFTRAQANVGGIEGEDFTLTRVKDYAVAQVDSETVLASKGNPNALLSAVEAEMDRKLHSLIRSIAIGMYGDSTGQRGVIDSISSGVITLATEADVTNFEKGMVLQACANAASNARTARGYVIAVDRDGGTVTVSTTATGSAGDPTDWAAADLLYADGDHATANDTNMISGLAAWLPSSAPSASESFFGVDRSSDATRLAGHRLSGTGKTIEEALYDLAVRIAREGGTADHAFVGFEKYASLAMSLQTKVSYNQHKVGQISFEAIKINGPKGPINVYPDQNCPNAVGYVLSLDSWCLHSLGAAPRVIDVDGKQWLRTSSSDGIEIRMGFYGNLKCNAPGWNGRTTL
jgi:hypothetical protein